MLLTFDRHLIKAKCKIASEHRVGLGRVAWVSRASETV